MRILIDECVDERLRISFYEHDRQTARYAGFAGLKNGDLLQAIESAHFDVPVTVDLGWEHEQNLVGRNVAVVIFCAKSNRLKGLLPQVPACLSVLRTIKPGAVAKVPAYPEWLREAIPGDSGQACRSCKGTGIRGQHWRRR